MRRWPAFAIVALLAACRTLPFPDPELKGDYGKALKKWTRQVALYSGLETRAFVRVVYLSPEFVEAQAKELSAMRAELADQAAVTLASGRESDFYIDTKQASLTAEGHYLVGRLVLGEIRARFPAAQGVGGLTMGADPIASAVSLTSFLQPPALPAFYVRKEPKGHGTGQWIEGRKSLPAGSQVVVVEDVVTTGASTLKAVERCRGEGLRVLGVVALVDREEGGREAVQAAGVQMFPLFRRSEFP